MPTPFESALLNLKLFDLRSEPVLREAPFLAEIRTRSSEPDFCGHLEHVVMSAPDAAPIMSRRLAQVRDAPKDRRAV